MTSPGNESATPWIGLIAGPGFGSKGARGPRRGERGFTMIELIVVVALVGLIGAMALGAGRPISPSSAARAAARDVASGLRAARSQAIETARPVAFALDFQQKQFRVGIGPSHALPPQLEIKLLTADAELGAKADGSGMIGRIRFEPDGSSTGGRVTLAGGQRVYAIGVDWLSGRVAIAELPSAPR